MKYLRSALFFVLRFHLVQMLCVLLFWRREQESYFLFFAPWVSGYNEEATCIGLKPWFVRSISPLSRQEEQCRSLSHHISFAGDKTCLWTGRRRATFTRKVCVDMPMEFFLNEDAFCRFCRITRKQKNIQQQNVTSSRNRAQGLHHSG